MPGFPKSGRIRNIYTYVCTHLYMYSKHAYKHMYMHIKCCISTFVHTCDIYLLHLHNYIHAYMHMHICLQNKILLVCIATYVYVHITINLYSMRKKLLLNQIQQTQSRMINHTKQLTLICTVQMKMEMICINIK